MAPATVYLITGTNRPRGIGAEHFFPSTRAALIHFSYSRFFSDCSYILSQHENTFVYATVRDPTEASALDDLKAKYPDRIAVVKWLAADVKVNVALAEEINRRHGRLDTVIANAGALQ